MKGKILAAALAAIIFPITLSGLSAGSFPDGQTVFRVSPDGNDGASGSASDPWRTPETASWKVQEYMSSHPGVSVILEVAPGTYQIRDSLVFEGLESPLTVTALPGGRVVFSGEAPLYGWRRSPRFPDIPVYECTPADWGVGDYGDPASRTNRPELYCNGDRQTLARWPNTGFVIAGKALGATAKPDNWLHLPGTSEGILEYTDPRIERWTAEKDPRLFGYWFWDWSDNYHKLASVDTEARFFTVDEPWSRYGYRDSCRFYGLNLLCELDCEGEYYLDRESGVLYWYAPEGVVPPEDSDSQVVTSIPVFNRGAMIYVRDCKGLTVSGICFEGGRGGALSVSGGTDNSILECLFTRFGDTVISVEGGRGHLIRGCYLHELGCGGIKMRGGDRVNLVSSDFAVRDNIVDNFSLFKRTYEPALFFYGVGLTVANNRFSNSSSSALRLEGNDITVEYNQCFDLVKESDDQGGYDVYFDYSFRNIVLRYNHWKNISGGMFAGAAGVRFDDIISGQTVYSNIFENCGGGNPGAGFGGVQINGGRDNLVYNNIFYDCRYAVSGRVICGELWHELMAGEKVRPGIDAVDALGPIYEARYPELKAHYGEDEGWNYVWNNLLINGERFIRETEHFVLGGNASIRSHRPIDDFLNPLLQKNYGLEPIPFKQIGPRDNKWK